MLPRIMLNECPAALIAQYHPPEIAGQIPLAGQPLVGEALSANLFDFSTVRRALVVPMLHWAERTLSGDDGVATDLENSAAPSGIVGHGWTFPFGEQRAFGAVHR